MNDELKTLDDFLRVHAVNAGYDVADESEVKTFYKLVSKFSLRNKRRHLFENSFFLYRGDEKVSIIFYTKSMASVMAEEVNEQERFNATNGIYTAHIFQKDGVNFGVERYVSTPSQSKAEGKPVVLRPLECEIASSEPHILAYFLLNQKRIELYLIGGKEGAIRTAYKIQDITSGNLYFPHGETSKRSIPYFKPEIEVSEVHKLIPRKQADYGSNPATPRIILPDSLR